MTGQSKIDLVIYHHLVRGMVAGRAKVEYTGCPITSLILQNEPNFRPFWLKIEDLPKKRTQFYLPRCRLSGNPILFRRGAARTSCLAPPPVGGVLLIVLVTNMNKFRID
jgi:hypothetical protein